MFFLGANEIDLTKVKRQQDSLVENLLPSISSTGVLLKAIDSTPSSIDFVFVLNVRESETYPPLLLPQDLACVEDKLSGYRSELYLISHEQIAQLYRNVFLRLYYG